MRILGLACALGGWLLALSGLLMTTSTVVRGVLACLGIALSLYGSLGVLNGYYLQRALWKK